MGQIQTLDEFLGLLLRRRLVIAAVAVLGTVLSLMYALSRPAIFEAVAVIQVESPTVAEGGGAPVGVGSAQRLQTIQQRLTTRENLLAMIDRHGLYEGLPLSNDEKVHQLRTSVRFQPVSSATPAAYGMPQQVSAVLIFAQADDRDRAARLANDFAQGILDAGAQGQAGRTRETVAFFAAEVGRLSEELAALEAQVAAYKNANAGALPAVRDLRRDEIVGIEGDLRSTETGLAALAAERAAIEAGGRALRETDRRRLETLGAEVAALEARRGALLARRDALVATMAGMPEVERVLIGYERQTDQLRAAYDQATQRLAEAETAARLEDRQQGERFLMLERAVRPEYPITGGRKRLVMMGAVASVMAGMAVAFLLDLLHPVLRTTSQVERQLGLRPVVAIPEIPGLRPAGKVRPARGEDRARGGLWSRLLPRYVPLVAGLALLAGAVAMG